MRGFFAALGLLPGLAFGQAPNTEPYSTPVTAQGETIWVDLSEQAVDQIFHLPFAAHFQSGPYQLFSPNTATANSISGNLSGVQVSAWVHPHFTVGLGLQDAQSQALTESGELLYLDQMRWAGLITTGYLVASKAGGTSVPVPDGAMHAAPLRKPLAYLWSTTRQATPGSCGSKATTGIE